MRLKEPAHGHFDSNHLAYIKVHLQDLHEGLYGSMSLYETPTWVYPFTGFIYLFNLHDDSPIGAMGFYSTSPPTGLVQASLRPISFQDCMRR